MLDRLTIRQKAQQTAVLRIRKDQFYADQVGAAFFFGEIIPVGEVFYKFFFFHPKITLFPSQLQFFLCLDAINKIQIDQCLIRYSRFV